MINSNKLIQKKNLATLLALSLLGLPLLSACPRTPAGVGTGSVGSQNARTSLKVRFELPDARPDYVARIKDVEIKLSGRTGTPVTDRFAFAASASTKTIERTLSNVPTGTLSATVRLLDAEGKDVMPALSTSFSLSAQTTDAMLVRLLASPSLLPPLSDTSASLSTLRGQRRDLLGEIQRLSTRESDLLRQLGGLRNSPDPEDQVLKQQVQAELQVTQTQLQAKEAELELLTGQVGRLEAQSTGAAGSAQQDELQNLRDQAETLSASIEEQLSQRRLLAQEAAAMINKAENTSRLSQIQGELQTLDTRIESSIRQLQLINLQLQQLESRLNSQNTSVPTAQRKAQIEADLVVIRAQIAALEAEIPPLRTRYDALAQQTDLQNVQRREAIEAELRQKEAALSEAKALEAELVKQLQGL